MKRLLIVFIVLTTSLGLFAQTKISVFVTSKVLSQDYQAFLTDQLVEAVTNSNQYIAVNRSSELNTVLNRVHAIQDNGYIDPKQIVNATKQYGETQVCGVHVYQVDDRYVFQASLVDIATASIVKTISAYTSKDDWDFDSALEISQQLASKLMGTSEKHKLDNANNEKVKEIIKIEHGGYTYFIYPELGAMTYQNGRKACRDLVVEGYNRSIPKAKEYKQRNKKKKQVDVENDEFDKWRLPTEEEFYAIAEKTKLLKKKYHYWALKEREIYYSDSYRRWNSHVQYPDVLCRILPIMKVKKSDSN